MSQWDRPEVEQALEAGRQQQVDILIDGRNLSPLKGPAR
jgi:hypothetical protein